MVCLFLILLTESFYEISSTITNHLGPDSQEMSLVDVWNDWKSFHRKNYNPNREAFIYTAWLSNHNQVKAHNLRRAKGRELYSQEMNKFADRSRSKLLASLLQPVPFDVFHTEMEPVKLPKQDILDDYINWTDLGWVRDYKTEKFFPTGWTFSAVTSVEAQTYNITGIYTQLSRQEILDCVENNPGRPHITMDAFSYILRNGVTTERLYPMRYPQKRTCKRKNQHTSVAINSYHLLEPGDEENLKLAVALIGPISVSIKVTPNFFFYQTGIYYDVACSFSDKATNHAVLLVGYGTDLWGTEYWIIQNNWGNRWGENGFARVARDSLGNCGIASAAIYPSVDGIIFSI